MHHPSPTNSAPGNAFSPAVQQLAAVAKSLGHPARIAIVRRLASGAGCTCGELVAVLPLSQSTVSQHLLVLKEAGLLRCESQGSRTRYQLDRARWSQLTQVFALVLTDSPVAETNN
jgi:DNA-binding transcriptional ArsR family regulator